MTRHLVLAVLAAVLMSCSQGDKPVAFIGVSENRVMRAIRGGASVNGNDRYGMPPLARAAWDGRFDIVRLLVARGADVGARDAFGRQPIHRAIEGGHVEILDWLIHSGADVRSPVLPEGSAPIHLAVMSRCHACMVLLVADGADVNAKNALGQTPLHLASVSETRGGASQPEWLLDHGADPALRDARGLTFAHYAAFMNNREALDMLVRRKLPIDEPSPTGIRPVDTASWALAPFSLRWFEARGIRSETYPTEDPLESAARRNDAGLLSMLLASEPPSTRDGASGAKLRAIADEAKALSATRTLDVLLANPPKR